MATETNDDDAEKLSENPVRKSYPDDFAGVEYTADATHTYSSLRTPLGDMTLPGGDTTVSVQIHHNTPSGDADSVLVLMEQRSGDNLHKSTATLDPDTAAELALSLLDELKL